MMSCPPRSKWPRYRTRPEGRTGRGLAGLAHQFLEGEALGLEGVHLLPGPGPIAPVPLLVGRGEADLGQDLEVVRGMEHGQVGDVDQLLPEDEHAVRPHPGARIGVPAMTWSAHHILLPAGAAVTLPTSPAMR